MRSELDFKHSIIIKKSALKRSGKRAKKKVYKASGEAKIENADRRRALSDIEVVAFRWNVFHQTVRQMSESCGCSRQTIERALKGETFKHLNHIAKPWK